MPRQEDVVVDIAEVQESNIVEEDMNVIVQENCYGNQMDGIQNQ